MGISRLTKNIARLLCALLITAALPAQAENPETISVAFAMRTPQGAWVENSLWNVPAETTMSELLRQVLAETDITVQGLDDGYLASASKGTETLAQFGEGPNSGWLYYLNGEMPPLGINDCRLQDGDAVQFIYFTDWSQAPVFLYSTGFSDVPPEAWYAEAAVHFLETGLIQGVSSAEFAPDEAITREDLAVLFVRFARYMGADLEAAAEDSNTLSYYDVSEISPWAASAVHACCGCGLMQGDSEGRLRPRAPVTREELAVLFVRFAQYIGTDLEAAAADSNTLSYYDVSEVSSWAASAVHACCGCGLMQGDSDGRLRPRAPVSRGECAAFLMRGEGVFAR